jgi:polyhydroxybutyrate depolymerase
MKILRLLFILALWAVGAAEVQAADNLARREWKVNGVVREGLVYVPAQARTNATPVVFAFHGHGGSMRNAARSFGYHALWQRRSWFTSRDSTRRVA